MNELTVIRTRAFALTSKYLRYSGSSSKMISLWMDEDGSSSSARDNAPGPVRGEFLSVSDARGQRTWKCLNYNLALVAIWTAPDECSRDCARHVWILEEHTVPTLETGVREELSPFFWRGQRWKRGC